MRLRRLSLAAALAIATALLLAPAASAASTKASPERSAEIELKGTHGFKVSIAVVKGFLLVNARKGPASVNYFARHTVIEGDRFAGKLPGIGGISVRFTQRGKTTEGPSPCKRGAPLVRHGEFVGSIRLHGEKGYTTVDATHATGTVTEASTPSCGGEHPERSPKTPAPGRSQKTEELLVVARSGSIELTVDQVSSEAEGPLASFVAATHLRKHDGMVVTNSVLQISTAPSLLLTDDSPFPEEVTVQPSRNFAGSAAFHLLDPEHSSLTGNLAVTLPGVGRVRLAGPSFKSSVCLNGKCKGSLPADPEGGPGVLAETRQRIR